MKRRNFLRMLGSAAAAPALPALPAGASLSPQLKALGVAHAHKFPMISVLGMTRRLGVSETEAAEMISYLSRKGIVSGPGVTGTGLTSAASRVFRPANYESALAASKRLKAKALKVKETAQKTVEHLDDEVTDWLTHLQKICVQQGMELQPRAIAVTA